MADLPFTNLPSTWRMERLDRLFKVIKEDARLDDEPVSAFIDGVVTLRSNRPDAIIKGSGQEIGYKHLEEGDLVISGMNAHLGGLGISDSTGKCTPVYTVLRKTRDLEERYISYYLWHAAKTGYIKSLVNAVRYNSADFGPETVKRFMVPVPPIEDQRQIANYLDSLVPRINSLISLFHKQLKLSMEAFRVLVEEKTSSKLNKNDEKIPVRRILQIDPITDIPKTLDPLVTFLSLEDVQPGNLANFNEFRNLEDVLSGYSRFKRGDILVPKVSPSFGHGRAVVVPDTVSEVGFASTEVYVLRCRNPRDAKYVCASLRSRDFLMQGESTYQGVAGVKRADKEFILNWEIRWPQEHLRAEIANEIDEAQRKLEMLENFTQKGVFKLAELRSSVISDAITKNEIHKSEVR